MTEQEIYQKAIDKWGLEKQALKAVEEMAELIQALVKDNFHKPASQEICENIHEEIADVEIMLAQLRLIYPSDLIDKQKHFKLKRLQETIEKG